MRSTRTASSPSALVAFAALIALVHPPHAAAQSAEAGIRYGAPVRLPLAEEIALARSAAPAAVSEEATVLVLAEGAVRWVVAEEGTSGATCYVSRTWPGSLEPHCFDPEGSKTILPIHLRTLELGHAGASEQEIEREIDAGVAAGRFRYPSHPAMSYMLSSAQKLVSDEGQPAGAWKPHLMIYWPGLTKADLGGTSDGPTLSDSMILVDEGTDEACLIIVYPGFVEPALASVE
jgi:hypothetical protein